MPSTEDTKPTSPPAVASSPSEAPPSSMPAADGESAASPGAEGGAPSAGADPTASDAEGQFEPAAPATAPQTRAETKGVADVVFLIDVSGSMSPIIDALRKNIEAFVDSLSSGDANNAAPVRDWRGKVVGYRDIEAAESEGLEWLEDHPFVRDAVALKAQLAALRAQGGVATSPNPFSTRFTRSRRWKRRPRVHSPRIPTGGGTGAKQRVS
ncbi:MAG: hypothetical protein ACREYE_29145 [Gammaproteobacteria bacterium]